jgi:hypothetical protein
MSRKKWMAAGIVLAGAVAATVWAVSSAAVHFRVFRTTAEAVAVAQTSTNGIPRYDYQGLIGSNLVALALGVSPTSNQVLAVSVNCDSSLIDLIVFDKSSSNITTIAQSTNIEKVVQANLVTSHTNSERFVAQLVVQPVGNLAGGYLTMAGRLDLDTDGCVRAVLVTVDRDPEDRVLGDSDVPNLDPDRTSKDRDLAIRRAGQAHFIGVLDIISEAGPTNTVLVPFGHLTLRRQLDEFIAE